MLLTRGPSRACAPPRLPWKGLLPLDLQWGAGFLGQEATSPQVAGLLNKAAFPFYQHLPREYRLQSGEQLDLSLLTRGLPGALPARPHCAFKFHSPLPRDPFRGKRPARLWVGSRRHTGDSLMAAHSWTVTTAGGRPPSHPRPKRPDPPSLAPRSHQHACP